MNVKIMSERITMASTAGVIKKPQPSVESSKNSESVNSDKHTLVVGSTGAGKNNFQIKNLLESIK